MKRTVAKRTSSTPRKRAPDKRPPKRPTRDRPGKPGPIPLLLRGFDRKMLRPKYLELDVPPDPWTENTPVARVLKARRCGATHSLAAAAARVHPYTVTTWISRGRDVIGEGQQLDELEANGLDDETLAAAAFAVLDDQAEAAPGVVALDGISRAAADEWRAGVALLRVLPATKRDYSEVQKLEHSGPDGDAIPVDARAAGLVEALRVFQAGAKPTPDVEEPDGAGDG